MALWRGKALISNTRFAFLTLDLHADCFRVLFVSKDEYGNRVLDAGGKHVYEFGTKLRFCNHFNKEQTLCLALLLEDSTSFWTSNSGIQNALFSHQWIWHGPNLALPELRQLVLVRSNTRLVEWEDGLRTQSCQPERDESEYKKFHDKAYKT